MTGRSAQSRSTPTLADLGRAAFSPSLVAESPPLAQTPTLLASPSPPHETAILPPLPQTSVAPSRLFAPVMQSPSPAQLDVPPPPDVPPPQLALAA